MPKPKKYWGVEKNVNRHGRPRWYYRAHKTAPRLRLPDSYGSPEFEAAWRAARAGEPLPLPVSPPGRAKARKASRGSLGWLIQLHLASPQFKALRPATQRPRRAMLEGLASAKGTTDIEDVTKSVIQASVDARRATPHMANVWLGVVNGLFEWATRETLPDPLTGEAKPILEENPALGVKRVAIPKPADPDEETGPPYSPTRTWPSSRPPIPRERWSGGCTRCCSTGFRVGDAARVGRQHVQRDGTIKIKTEKTGTEVEIDIVPPLKRALAAGPHGRPEVLNFLTTARGKAWDKNYLGWWFGDACRAIGLNRSAHGLRKAAAGEALRRARRDRPAVDGLIRLADPGDGHPLRADGGAEDDGAGGAAGHGLGRDRERNFPPPSSGLISGEKR